MNQNLKRFFSIAAFLCTAITTTVNSSCSSCPTGCTNSQNLLQPHALSVSASRQLELIKNAWAPMPDEEGWFGMFGVGVEYMNTIGTKKCDTKVKSCCTSIGSMPFWSGTNTTSSTEGFATYSNTMSLGNNTGGFDLDAYQMGLGPVTTNGTVTINPIMFQAGADFMLYFGAHRTERGFWFKIHGPVGVTRVKPNLTFSETVTPVEYPLGSLSLTDTTKAPYSNIAEAFDGQNSAGFLQKMLRGRISNCKTSSAHFGDPEFSLGYNVWAEETKNLGIALCFSAPTGNKARAIQVLEPIFGRNGHWAAGGELLGHWRFLQSEDNDNMYADLWLEGTVMHLFRSCHERSFDLKANGAGSKYLLLGKYTGGTFQNIIENAVNITTMTVESTFSVEGDFALAADFHWKNWSIMIGYEGWGRTCESLYVDTAPGSTNLNDYAVLGRQTAYTTGGAVLNNCEPLAQIGNSQIQYNSTSTRPTGIADATVATNRIPEDIFTALDVNNQCAHAAYTSKPFIQAQYTWTESDFRPFLGISGAAEISNMKNSAASFWSVGAQGGISF